MKRYDVIYADPPWSYGAYILKPEKHISKKYNVMSFESICTLPVPSICSKDSILFLWSTTPCLPEALQVMKSWGFKYKTTVVWNKIGIFGLGFWFRVQTEFLLIGVRGSIKAFRYQRRNVFDIKPRKHSQKPEEIRKVIEEITKGMNRIELFAREKNEGWDVWGDEDESDIEWIIKKKR